MFCQWHVLNELEKINFFGNNQNKIKKAISNFVFETIAT